MGIKNKGGNTWEIDAIVRVNGRQKRKRLTFIGSKSKAIHALHRLKIELKESPKSDSRFLKCFGGLVDFYCADKPLKKNDFTIKRLKEELGDAQLSELKERFHKFVQILKKQITIRGTKIKLNSVNRYIVFAKAICNHYIRFSNGLETSPLANYQLFKVNDARDRVLTPDEQKRLLNNLKIYAPHLLPAIQFFMEIPIRKSELVNMKRDQVNLFDKVIYLKSGTTKNGFSATLPIPKSMITYFENLPTETNFVFYKYNKKHNSYRSLGDFKKAWNTALEKAHIRDFRIHDFRHMACAKLARQGVSESVIMKIGNWRTSSVFRRYRHIYLDEIQIAGGWTLQPNDCNNAVDLKSGQFVDSQFKKVV